MAGGRTQRAATVGVAEHGNSAVLVTLAPAGELLDRRDIELTERGLATHPHHHEGSWAVGRYLNTPGARALTLSEAVALVDRVRASAGRGARESLEALATAAEARGWSVHWYDRESVFREATAALGGDDIHAFLSAMGRAIGPPWRARHKLAAAAALAAVGCAGARSVAG